MKYQTNQRRSWVKIALVALMSALVLIAAALFVGWRYYTALLGPVGPSSESVRVLIPQGATVTQIATQLKDAQVIQDERAFSLFVRFNDARNALQAGEYYLRPNMTVPQIVSSLTQGRVATDLLTILPGKRLDQLRQTFISAGFNESEVDAALNADQYRDIAIIRELPVGASLEGYLYPDSYQKTGTTKPAEIVRQSLLLMDKAITADIRSGFAAQGLTVHQGIIMASIVEKEVNKAEDMPKVAQVFLLRQARGMTLGSDVTALYGAIVDDVALPKDAGKAANIAIGHDSPYNTRIYRGLPPGPISNVGAVTIKAVAQPAGTDYLFFVAGDDGTTYYSRTIAEHEAYARQYCIKLCGR